MNGYDPMQPNTGILGDVPAVSRGAPRKVMFRVKEGASPGWPGFFGWLAATHPKLYDYARVALPNVVEDRQGLQSEGSLLAGDYGHGYGNPVYTDAAATVGGYSANGPGNPVYTDSVGEPGYVDAAATLGANDDLSPVTLTVTRAATEGITNSTPMPTTAGNSQIVQTITQAASALLPLYQQQQILNAQLQRAQKGLPPLDTSRYIDPNTGLNVGLNAGTQNTLLMLGGLAVGGLLLFKVLGGRR
jgi:hypothetical protein